MGEILDCVTVSREAGAGVARRPTSLLILLSVPAAAPAAAPASADAARLQNETALIRVSFDPTLSSKRTGSIIQ